MMSNGGATVVKFGVACWTFIKVMNAGGVCAVSWGSTRLTCPLSGGFRLEMTRK